MLGVVGGLRCESSSLFVQYPIKGRLFRRIYGFRNRRVARTDDLAAATSGIYHFSTGSFFCYLIL